MANEPMTIPFALQAQTVINVSPAMRQMYGPVPNVDVQYWDGTEYVKSVFVQKKLDVTIPDPDVPWHPGMPPVIPQVTKITIDHGGPMIGVVKIGGS